MDLERINLLLSTFHASLNVPNTAAIQREIQIELKGINREYLNNPSSNVPEASTDGSGGTQDVSEESLFQERRV